jgi:hypothetical protein
VAEGSGPTEKKIVNPTFNNFLADAKDFRVTKRYIMGAKAPNFGPYWNFENYDKKDPPRGIEDIAMFVKRVRDGRGVEDAAAAKPSPRAAAGGADGGDKMKRTIDSLKQENKALRAKKARGGGADNATPPGKGDGAIDYSTTKTGGAVQFKPKAADLQAFTEIFVEDGDEEADVPCCQGFVNALYPRGPRFTNGVLPCKGECGGTDCVDSVSAADLRKTWGDSKVDDVKSIFEYYGWKPKRSTPATRSPKGRGRGRGRGGSAGKTPGRSTK